MAYQKERIGGHKTKLQLTIAPFFAGIGSLEMTDVANVLDSPNSMSLDHTIRRHQPETGTTIIKISEREMRVAMANKIKSTFVVEKVEDCSNKWEHLPSEKRDTI